MTMINKVTQKELKNFAITLGVVFGIWAVFTSIFSALNIYILSISCIFFLFTINPKPLQPIYYLWMKFADCLSWVMTKVILGVLYYFILTPIGLIGRLLGKSFLNQDFSNKKSSYWIVRNFKIEKQNYKNRF